MKRVDVRRGLRLPGWLYYDTMWDCGGGGCPSSVIIYMDGMLDTATRGNDGWRDGGGRIMG